MRFEFKVDDLKTEVKRAYDDVELSVTGAMTEVMDGLKTELREQVTSSGLGQRLANTWRGKRFPEVQPSIKIDLASLGVSPELRICYRTPDGHTGRSLRVL